MYFCLDKEGILSYFCIIKNNLNMLDNLFLAKKSKIMVPASLIFFVVVLNVSCIAGENIYGHSIAGSDSGNGIQIQKNGNYEVELFVNPSKPLLNENTDIFLRITSSAGDELIELPVSISILKEGVAKNSSANNYVVVRDGHYNFPYTFSETGKYLLYVDIRDTFYTLDTLNFIFVLDVGVPISEQFFGFILGFLAGYFYIYIPIAAILIIFLFMRHKRKKVTAK
ncbi:MAG: hypothetical protein M3162_04000 [Thermoproteota archaeon]|nr:hypothetical protein [Thermoproteota archaeon]